MESRRSGDFILTLLVIILVVFGVVMVFSSSYYYALNREGSAYYYLKMDTMWACIGAVLMFVTSKINYRTYARYAPFFLIGSILLLLLIFTPLGVEINYAKRWLGVGPITIMPGEVAKPCVAIYAAWFLSRKPDLIRSLRHGVFPMFLMIGVYAGLILAQPNLSTAITVTMIIVSIMFAAGLKYQHVMMTGLAGLMGVVALIAVEPYRLQRFTSFLDPFADAKDTGFQVVQSLLALGSGGLFGVGLGKSVQKTLYLPEPQNDFIFAIIGEELGYIGCTILILCFLLLVWRGIHIAINAKDLFGCLLATGLTSMIAVQVIINIAVATASMPPTGIALPFVSWGGNSLAIFMASAGILINISKNKTAG